MSNPNLKRSIRILFEVIRTGRPPSRQRITPAWWRWLLALLGVATAVLIRLIVE